MLVRDVCKTLGLELNHNQLVLRSVRDDELGESVLRIARQSCESLKVYSAKSILSDYSR